MPHDRKTFNYARMMDMGFEFPAIKVVKLSSGRYLIRDGRHRLLASKLLGLETIRAKFSLIPMKEEYAPV